MFVDLVVDANILGLSENPAMPEYDTCRSLLTELIQSSVLLVVDEGFSLVEADNRSIIGREYLDHARSGSLGYALLLACATSGRLRHVSTSVSDADRRFINRTINRNSRDRVYVKVALRSVSKALATNDWDDFDVEARRALNRRFELAVLAAHECLEELTAA
jgi:hypothetical protein